MLFAQGIVKPLLDSAGKPEHVAANALMTSNTYASNGTLTSPDWFAMWYQDNATYNKTLLQTLRLNKTTSGYQYASLAFFPIDGMGWGNTPNNSHNYAFTSEVRYWFEYQGGEQLQFLGDDDVWVFVNRQLAVDLGGLHTTMLGSIVLDATNGSGTVCENADVGCAAPRNSSLGLELGKVYEIVVFQAERHTVASNYTLTLGNFNAIRSVCSSRCGDGIVSPDEACDLGTSKNTGAYGTCTPDCKLPAYCGDSLVGSTDGEQCDQGVNVANYGYNHEPACGPTCQWTHYCGDKQVDTLFGEQCDDGNDVSGDGCETNCTLNPGCGNSLVEAGEQCDDGNAVSGDGCSEFCTIEQVMQ
jgi:fibro-slime domain-containing protein